MSRAVAPISRRSAALGLSVVCLAAILTTGRAAAEGPVCAADTITLLAAQGPVSFTIEIADDPEEQSRGLMFRQSLAPDAGMLFVYDEPGVVGFWMRNTMIPLDMIFLDETGAVLNVEADAVPYSEVVRKSAGPVIAVLEINGGQAAELGIGAGTQAIHPAFVAAPDGARCPAD
ncbi:MAG: DUF192 domain-containing protein [Pikeienuella sp.]